MIALQQSFQQCETTWSFPHVEGDNYLSVRNEKGLIDTYTASYMRWLNKAHVIAWLRTFAYPCTLRPVFLDVETTGSRRYSEVIEICIVNEQGQTLYHSLVNPNTEIEPIATAVHGLTWRDVKNAPLYTEIHEDITKHLSNHVVIAYNASFDVRLLKQTADHYQLALPGLHIGCLMNAYAKYRDVFTGPKNGQRRLKLYKLEEAITTEQIDLPPFHRAERDAKSVYRLFSEMKRQADSV